jgi:hypothetical protein
MQSVTFVLVRPSTAASFSHLDASGSHQHFLLVFGYVSFSFLSGVLWFSLPIYLKVALNCSFIMFRRPYQRRIVGNTFVCFQVKAAEQFDADALIQGSW